MIRNILVTGASGKTGKHIVSSLARAGLVVRALIHHAKYEEDLRALGARDILVGDMRSTSDLERAMEGMDGIYHICPNMTPDEYDMGSQIIQLCQQSSIRRFVYHSVLHPQIQGMPHHWQKMRVESRLFSSGLDYTILQPTAYMQNIAGYKTAILNGTYPMPYASAARISLVDLRDVAEVAAKMFVTDIGLYGTYELVGTQPLSQVDVARALSKHFERPVKAIEVSKEEWEQAAIKNQMSVYSRETLLSMFRYYDTFGLTGSPTTLTCLLGRKPITIEQYLQDELSTLS